MTLTKVAEKAWFYTLYETGGKYVLSVVCGGVAMYELNIPLEPDEGARAISDSAYVDALASEIRDKPHRFALKSIKI